jgi:hypothetical protein
MGRSHSRQPENFPNGIFTVTICFSISGFGVKVGSKVGNNFLR